MLSSTVPIGYHFDFQEYLFNTERHRLTQAKEGWKSFYWLDEKKKLIQASFHVHIDRNTAQSPFRATFGGVDFSSKLSQRHLTEFIREVETVLNDWKIQVIEIITCPQIYHSNKFSQQFQALVDNGFELRQSALASCIRVSKKIQFGEILEKANRKRLQKTSNLNFNLLPISELENVYNLIYKSRKVKDYELSLSLTQLGAVVNNLNEEFLLFGVYRDTTLIAAAICLRVSQKALYLFYADHLKEFEDLAPSVFLYSEIYKYCQQNNFELLDLGTSSENGITKFGLLEFKKSIGAVPSLKPTFFKQLND